MYSNLVCKHLVNKNKKRERERERHIIPGVELIISLLALLLISNIRYYTKIVFFQSFLNFFLNYEMIIKKSKQIKKLKIYLRNFVVVRFFHILKKSTLSLMITIIVMVSYTLKDAAASSVILLLHKCCSLRDILSI